MEPCPLEMRLLMFIRRPRRHLRREQSGRDTIRADAQRHERVRPLLGQVQEGGLAGRVGELALRVRFGDARAGGDVDDGARVPRDGLAALAE